IKHTNGFLAYVRDFVFFEDAKAGDELICYMEKTDEFGQLHIAKVEITDRSGQKVFAKGEIRIYELPQ
ncbi:MAG: hypothetical protein LBV66_02130, partial [Elusimicrobiota bacterium]|nr:hypothetical protein [Elusimicrobiota bacterium]